MPQGGLLRLSARSERIAAGQAAGLGAGDYGCLAAAAACEPQPAAPIFAAIGEPRSLRVLVVDDDPIVAAGTAAMIEDFGHAAVEASSAAAALDVLRSGAQIDLVITDYAMPAMSGTQLAAASAAIGRVCRSRS